MSTVFARGHETQGAGVEEFGKRFNAFVNNVIVDGYSSEDLKQDLVWRAIGQSNILSSLEPPCKM